MLGRQNGFLIAVVTGTAFALSVIIAFTLLARPTGAIFDAFNETMADMTGQTGSAWQSFNNLNLSFHKMYFPIAIGLIFFAFIYVLLHAQKREYVTGPG